MIPALEMTIQSQKEEVKLLLDQKIQEFAELLASKVPREKKDEALSSGRPMTPYDPFENLDLVTVLNSENIVVIDESDNL